jgi:hypothetical protein
MAMRTSGKKRINPDTGTASLSFIDRTGNLRFIQRTCRNCEAAGRQNQWHFDFDCRRNPQIKTFTVQYAANSGQLPGTHLSPTGYQM